MAPYILNDFIFLCFTVVHPLDLKPSASPSMPNDSVHVDILWVCMMGGSDDRKFLLVHTLTFVEVARAPGTIHRRSVHKYAVPSNHV